MYAKELCVKDFAKRGMTLGLAVSAALVLAGFADAAA
jgi:hypothetical protein